MHLLAAQSGVLDDGSEAVDLAQEPGDVVVISAADSELAALARACDEASGLPFTLRLANFMQLGHNLSVDTYLENTVAAAKLVVLRLLGGASYWPYGVEQLTACARANNIMLAVLPGDAEPDPALSRHATLAPEHCSRLHAYLSEGGPENASYFLDYCRHLIAEDAEPPAARPLLKAGLYWPGLAAPTFDDIAGKWTADAPVAAITFYRSVIEGGNTEPVEELIRALDAYGINALPVFVSSLKEQVSAATVRELFGRAAPDIVLNTTGFAVASASGDGGDNPLNATGCPVLQVVFAGAAREAWAADTQGLSARDLAMNVVLPELDGRILSRAISFKSDAARHPATQCRIVTYKADAERVDYVARLAANWIALKQTKPAERRVAIILANYPNRDGRIGNGVGYDTPASTINILDALAGAGYGVRAVPSDGNALIAALLEGPTNRPGTATDSAEASLSLADYRTHFERLPRGLRAEVEDRWGVPGDDPFVVDGTFRLAVRTYGNVVVAIQPARGYNIDPKATYHDPALVPPHGYFAFYIWLREMFGAQAVIHNGKHGNLEWLPGKAVALGPDCYPEAALGPLPNIYPFIVNDPGEGTQAKRRNTAVIIDHLTPPLTRAEVYGPLKDLEALIDEYFLAQGMDPRRLDLLRRHILDLSRSSGLDADSGLEQGEDDDVALQKLDNYICDLKEAQIRDGLHILGQAPQGRLETDLLVALTRVPRHLGEAGDQSLIRALAGDLGFADFDPLDCELGAPWPGTRPQALATLTQAPWRTTGDTIERLEILAARLVAGDQQADTGWVATGAVLGEIDTVIRPRLAVSGDGEMAATLTALDGGFVEPGPSGAPTRGRIDVLPTGRNFFSIDNRAVPTPAAWTLGQKSAELLLQRHFQDHGRWPASVGLSAWGTSNMRTGGDDIAQAFALIGARPTWDPASWRVTGFEIVPLPALRRPRVDVTLRISGFFRDAFPAQIDLFDSAVRAIGMLDEEADENPIAARMTAECGELVRQGHDEAEAARLAGYRVFGSKPGAYGAGLQALIDEKLWDERADLAAAYIGWGAYAYGSGVRGHASQAQFTRRLGAIEAVLHNQDNREHDLLDSDDYYQFEGGMTAAVEHVSGVRPTVYHNDHSRPERPVVRTLEEEIGRVVRSRVVNPKWIAGVMRHGYKGAFEIAATVDYLFAFSATTGAVRDHHFQLAYDAFIADAEVREFLHDNNPDGLEELSAKFLEATERGLWTPKSNSAYHELKALARAGSAMLESAT
jgi:cobaltochelatase CobN